MIQALRCLSAATRKESLSQVFIIRKHSWLKSARGREREWERWRDRKRADSFVQWFHEIWKGQLWETNRIKEKKLQLGYWLLLFVEEQKEIYLYESPRWSNIFPSSSEERAEPESKLLISFSCAQELWEVTDKARRYKYPKLVSSIGWLGSNR